MGAVQRDETLADVDANLQFVNHGMQALLDLLADSRPAKRIRAAALRSLLLPLADQVEQAATAVQLVVDGHAPG